MHRRIRNSLFHRCNSNALGRKSPNNSPQVHFDEYNTETEETLTSQIAAEFTKGSFKIAYVSLFRTTSYVIDCSHNHLSYSSRKK